MRIRSLLLSLIAPLALAACDGGTDAGTREGGEYIAALQSPNGPEGGAMLELTGGGVEALAAASATMFQQPVNGGVRVMLIRDAPGRVEFRVRIAPGSGLPTVRVVQVVDGEDQIRPSTDGYQVTFTRTRGDT